MKISDVISVICLFAAGYGLLLIGHGAGIQ